MHSFQSFPRRVSSALICLLLVFTFSCQRNDDLDLLPNPEKLSDDATYAYILSLGIDKSQIIDKGKYYLVEGDIAFNKGEFNNTQQNTRARISQYMYNNSTVPIVNFDSVHDVTVSIDDSWGVSDYRDRIVLAIQQACGRWNNIGQSKLHFNYNTYNSSAKIKFRNLAQNSTTGRYAQAFPPSSCGTNTRLIEVFQGNSANLTVDQLTYIFIHELGHSIGMMHTDETVSSKVLIPDTPTSDTYSIMNSGKVTIGNLPGNPPIFQAFSTNDLKSIRFLYPSSASATAPSYNQSEKLLTIRWTVSYFCHSNIDIQCIDGFGNTVQTVSVPNTGEYKFSTNGLSPDNYTFNIYHTSNTSRFLPVQSVYLP